MDTGSEFLHLTQYTLLRHDATKGLEVMKTYTIYISLKTPIEGFEPSTLGLTVPRSTS